MTQASIHRFSMSAVFLMDHFYNIRIVRTILICNYCCTVRGTIICFSSVLLFLLSLPFWEDDLKDKEKNDHGNSAGYKGHQQIIDCRGNVSGCDWHP